MKKLLSFLAATALVVVSFAASANAFQANGNAYRGSNGTEITINSLDSGRSFTFYGTPTSCDSFGASYDNMSSILNGSVVEASVTPCTGGVVKVCLNNGYNSGCSAYSKFRVQRMGGTGYY